MRPIKGKPPIGTSSIFGKFALGGAGMIFTESTSISPHGRIGVDDLGLWCDKQIAPLKRVVDFVHAQGRAVRRAIGSRRPQGGSQPLGRAVAPLLPNSFGLDDGSRWRRLGPSPLAAGPEWSVPTARHCGDC